MNDATRGISRAQAEAIVVERLARSEERDGIERAFVKEPDELPDHWVFYYQGRRYLEEGDINFALAGNAPIVVPKDGSALFTLSTAEPIAPQVERLRAGRFPLTKLSGRHGEGEPVNETYDWGPVRERLSDRWRARRGGQAPRRRRRGLGGRLDHRTQSG